MDKGSESGYVRVCFITMALPILFSNDYIIQHLFLRTCKLHHDLLLMGQKLWLQAQIFTALVTNRSVKHVPGKLFLLPPHARGHSQPKGKNEISRSHAVHKKQRFYSKHTLACPWAQTTRVLPILLRDQRQCLV